MSSAPSAASAMSPERIAALKELMAKPAAAVAPQHAEEPDRVDTLLPASLIKDKC